MEATPAQRQRSAALVVAMVALAGLGAASQVSFGGTKPAPCAAPSVVDGLLSCETAGGRPGARAWLAGARLDVNEAKVSELEAIPGVGPSMARAIVDRRTERRFASLEELDAVDGVGPKTLEKLRAFLEVR